MHNEHIKVLVDNSATVGALNNMGSAKSITLDVHSKLVWGWVLDHNCWLTVAHIPGILNVEADEQSRKSEIRTEWKLNEQDFNLIKAELQFNPTIDLFATRINCQLPRFLSFRPDPEAEAIDAFTLSWSHLRFYAFPPFICVDQVLQKIVYDKATGIIVVPDWPNQIWYHRFTDMIIRDIILPPRMDLLMLPNNLEMVHPLANQLILRAALVTGTGL